MDANRGEIPLLEFLEAILSATWANALWTWRKVSKRPGNKPFFQRRFLMPLNFESDESDTVPSAQKAFFPINYVSLSYEQTSETFSNTFQSRDLQKASKRKSRHNRSKSVRFSLAAAPSNLCLGIIAELEIPFRMSGHLDENISAKRLNLSSQKFFRLPAPKRLRWDSFYLLKIGHKNQKK